MAWDTIEIASFLKERPNRFTPDEANSLGLKRLDKIDFSGRIHVIDPKRTRTNMILIKSRDLVLSGINAEKGAVSVYEGKDDVLATIHYSSYEYDRGKVNIDYLKWFLKSSEFKRVLKEQAGSGIKTEIKPKKFLPLKIGLPTKNEQVEIVQKLNSVSDEISEIHGLHGENDKLLNQLRKAILQEAVKGKLVPQDPDDEPAYELLQHVKAEKERLIADGKTKKLTPLPPIHKEEIPFELPTGWVWCRLGDALEERPRNGLSIKESTDGHVKNLRLSATTTGKFLEDEIKFVDVQIPLNSFLWLEPGDILVQRSNSIEYVGVSAIFDKAPQEFIYPDLMMKLKVSQEISSHYVQTVISSPLVREFFRHQAIGTSGSMKKINQTTVMLAAIPLAPRNEQKRIVAKVDQLMQLCDELEEKLKQSQQDAERLMQAVLQEAFGNSTAIGS